MLEKQYTLVCHLIIFLIQIILHVEYVSRKTLRECISEIKVSSLTAPYVLFQAKSQQSTSASV